MGKHHGFGHTNRRIMVGTTPCHLYLSLCFCYLCNLGRIPGRTLLFGSYLSPLYSPELFGDSSHSWFGNKPGWWPKILPWSPALLVLWAPGLFRLTCYYYRGAYYKAFWADPPSCTVTEPRKKYRGENSFPLIIQNIHRYLLYIALFFLLFLAYDVWKALWFTILVRRKKIWYWCWHIGVSDQCYFAWRIYIGLPFVAACGGWIYGSPFRCAGSPESIWVCKLFQQEAYVVGMDEFILGCVFRYLCPFVFHGGVERLENNIRRPAPSKPPLKGRPS